MRKSILPGRAILLILSALILFVACNKEISATGSTASTTTGSTTSTSSTIAVATDSAGIDSVYIIQACHNGYFRDSIAASALPASILSYLTANYSGYTFDKGYEIKDSAGTIGGYVVIISYNGKPVGLLFDASGNFQRVLEQREAGDIHGDGWHHGGRFGNRDGQHRDTLAISSLPSAVTSYLSVNYPSDTLVRAYLNRDSSILVISKDNGLFATLFTSSGVFVKRESLNPTHQAVYLPDQFVQSVNQDSLPAADLSYLTTTYPNYVIENAFSITVNTVLQGYVTVIDANNTKYAVWFDASGNVLATLTIW